LAADLDDLGIRARLSDRFLHPVTLRCWDPDRAGEAMVVTCERTAAEPAAEPAAGSGAPDSAGSGTWVFRLPDGTVLADAEDITQPGQAPGPARTLAAMVTGAVTGEQA
jgi:hypothetical protein